MLSFSEDRYDDRAVAGADVAFEMDDLLPRAQERLAVAHGRRKRRAQERGLEMRMAVAVVPGHLVAVIAARRNQAVEHLGQVAFEARLELDHAHGRRASDAKHVGDARRYARALDDRRHLTGEGRHLPMALGLEREFFLMDHGFRGPFFLLPLLGESL